MKKHLLLFILSICFASTLIGIEYFLVRSDIFHLFLLFGLSWIFYLLIYRIFERNQISLRRGIGLAFFLRLILLGAMPTLSDDFYRFIWDGHLLVEGINPYLYTPRQIFDFNILAEHPFYVELLDQMNSPFYYSVYTPFNQLFFAFAAVLGGKNIFMNILWLKIFLLIFEMFNFFLLFKILKLLNKPVSKMLLYALNPLVILEIVGNVHFEGIVLTGLLGSVYFYLKSKPGWSGILWAWAVAIKLTPLMFGPLFLKGFWKRKTFVFVGFSGILILLSFLPLIQEYSFLNFWQSIRLYQGRFEFNPSIYYILREIGIIGLGYNPIATLTPWLSLITLVLILILVYKSKKIKEIGFIELMVVIYLVYLILQPVVHPWYILPGLGLSVLTDKKAFLGWSFFVFLSYHVYGNPGFEENFWWLVLEYTALFLLIIRDYFSNFVRKKTELSK